MQTTTTSGSETVLLGCLVNEHLRLWRSDGHPACVRVLQPSALRESLARGLAPRTSIEPARFREAARFDPAGVLRIAGQEFAVETCSDPPVRDGLWSAAIGVLRDAATDAISRGEYVVVAPGGWDAVSEPYLVAGARKRQGEWSVYVESVPAPRAPSWPEPADGQPGWGVTAPAGTETLGGLGELLADAAAMWALSPLDLVLAFGRQPDGPWPPEETHDPVAQLFEEMRADVEELHSSRQMSRARELSQRAGAHFNHNTYPVYFKGDLGSRLVLVEQHPFQRDNRAAHYGGDFEHADFGEYVRRHRWSGRDAGAVDADLPLEDWKRARFVQQWGVIEVDDGNTAGSRRERVTDALDQTLQLELIPYGARKPRADQVPAEMIEAYYERIMGVIDAYPRDYVILCGAGFDQLLEPHIVEREDHTFRLRTSSGTGRTKYHFSNLVLGLDGNARAVGFAPNFANEGAPMGAYGQRCHELYRDIRP